MKDFLEFGILNIDKPSGPTSFSISDFVRKKLKLRKTSHFGTLDPKVTGVLPIALNRGCKLTGYFLGKEKTYVGIARFHEEVDLKKIQKIIDKKFLGKIKQTPPVKSRVKRQEREREIHYFKLLEKDGKDILFELKVQGGTYIRKLIDDLGKELGLGAHMLELRRTEACVFSEEDERFVNLYDFEKAVDDFEKGDDKPLKKIIIPGEEAIKNILPVVQVNKGVVKKLYTGKAIFVEDLKKEENFEKEELVCVFSGDLFIGIYRVTNEEKSKIFARSEFVMQPLKS